MNDPAGIAGRAPAPTYRVDGLSFGSVTLRRETTAPWSWSALELTRATGTSTFRVAVAPLGADDLAVIVRGVRSLVRDHGLLGRPELLRDGRADDIPAASPAAEALARMAARVPPDSDEPAVCEGCAARKVSVARCPHAGMRDESLLVLCLLHPELAFERAGVLVPAASRFVLPTALARRLRDDQLAGEGGPGQVERVAPEGDRFTAGALKAITLAVQGWGFSESPERLVRTHAVVDDRWPAHFVDAGTEPLDVACEAPATLEAEPVAPPQEKRAKAETAKPAPVKPAPAKPAPAKPAPVKSAPAKSEVAKPAPDRSVPQGLFMATGLKDMGYGPTELKRLLKDGTLVREGFGWYRFTRAPT